MCPTPRGAGDSPAQQLQPEKLVQASRLHHGTLADPRTEIRKLFLPRIVRGRWSTILAIPTSETHDRAPNRHSPATGQFEVEFPKKSENLSPICRGSPSSGLEVGLAVFGSRQS